MSVHSNSTSDSRPASRHIETGFPDWLASHTTSRRHPDAVVDPNFAISDEHFDPSKSLHRSRKSLLRKHKRTISKGKITDEELNNLRDDQQCPTALSTTDSAIDVAESKPRDLRMSLDSSSKDPEKIRAEGATKGQISAPVSPGFHFTASGESEDKRKANIFRKWGGK